MWDVAIVGGGPAGMAAAIMLGSEKINAIVFDPRPGGQQRSSAEIRNLPGHPRISGIELTERLLDQAASFGVTNVLTSVQEISRDGIFVLDCANAVRYRARSVIIATGLTWKTLDVPGGHYVTPGYYMDALTLSHIPSTQPIAVIGGGNSAAQFVCAASAQGISVDLYSRRPITDTMSAYLTHNIRACQNVNVVSVEAQRFTRQGNSIIVHSPLGDRTYGAVYGYMGFSVNTRWLRHLVECDEHGKLVIPARTPGLFIAGDVRAGAMPRIAAAMADGALAASMALAYITEHTND